MRFNYKVVPYKKPHPAFPNEGSTWMPMLPVRLSVGHGQQTPRLEALIDSGAADTLFRSDVGAFLGLKIDAGVKGSIGGIVPGAQIEVFYHEVNLWVGTGMIRIKAGFSPNMSIAAILGRRGFFEHFIVTFDPSANPPGFDIQRIARV